MTYDQCRTEEEKIQFLMKIHNFTEAEARVSCAINANIGKHIGDLRVADAQEPATPQKERTYATGRKATAR